MRDVGTHIVQHFSMTEYFFIASLVFEYFLNYFKISYRSLSHHKKRQTNIYCLM